MEINVYCHMCGASLLKESSYCHQCGSKLLFRIPCKKCGMFCSDNVFFCHSCGAVLKIKKEKESFKQALLSFFSENRVALLISTVGLALSLYQFDELKLFLKDIIIIDSQSDVFTIKTTILFSILLTVSLYNYKVPIIPDVIVLPEDNWGRP